MDNRIVLTDENGQETEMEIVLTIDNEETGRRFVLIKGTDPEDEDVYPFAYDDNGNLDALSDPEEIEMCSEVLLAFEKENHG
ncbi:MAG: DUF1292 domain-containing protein [Solobacterium sp.]|nr:DUF1292 domain-containing protein [Solobacterium sp.]